MNTIEKIKSLVRDKVVIIAWRDAPSDTKMTIQDFVKDGESYIPLFTSPEKAKEQTEGSQFTERLVEVDAGFLATLFKGSENIVLNPGEGFDLKIKASELLEIIAKEAAL